MDMRKYGNTWVTEDEYNFLIYNRRADLISNYYNSDTPYSEVLAERKRAEERREAIAREKFVLDAYLRMQAGERKRC